MFHQISLIIPALVLLPNLVFFSVKPVNVFVPFLKEPIILVVLKRIGQITAFIGPLFFAVSFNGWPEKIAAGFMAVMLLLYYFCWIRFFSRKREYRWLFEPLFFIPVPMAVFPIAYFLLGAGIMHSLPLLAAGVVFAAGHIPVSLLQHQYVGKNLPR